MSKENKASIKRKNRRRIQNNPLFPLLLALGGFVLILWGAYTWWNSRESRSDNVTIEVKGSPSLKVDRELVDLGDVKLNKTVSVSFQLSNVGDKTLLFNEQPYIEVLEGC